MSAVAVTRLTLVLAALVGAALPAGARADYQVPADNPFVSTPGAAPEVYAYGLRNPYRFSFDRATGDLLIGDVGGGAQEEINWIGVAAARGANFGWPCREGSVAGPRPDKCPLPGAIEPLFDYSRSGGQAVTGGFVVRDTALTGLVGRYLYADYFVGDIRSLALNPAAPDDRSTGATVTNLVSFGEDAAGRLYAAGLTGNQVVRLVSGGVPGTLATQPRSGSFNQPIAIGAVPGDADRLFVAQRGGAVRLVVDDSVRPSPFLTVTPSTDGERGLLSVAAAPDYATSGKVYVYYTDPGGDIRVDEFRRSTANPEQAEPAGRNVLTIEHSSESNHNGGQLHFGADGCLWITTGDGGGQADAHNNAQNLGTLLGKVLRIDPDPPGSGGAVCGAPAPPPPPITCPATGCPEQPFQPPRDIQPPLLRSSVKPRQRVLELGGVVVYARCVNEDCQLSAGGRLRIGKRQFRLREHVVQAELGQRVRLKPLLKRRSRIALRRALRTGRRATVRVGLRARDGRGNKTPIAHATVRVRR